MTNESDNLENGSGEGSNLIELGNELQAQHETQHGRWSRIALDPAQHGRRVMRSHGVASHDVGNDDANRGSAQQVGRVMEAEVCARNANEYGDIQQRKNANAARDNEDAYRNRHPQHCVIARERTPR